jgi:hypothetical protein
MDGSLFRIAAVVSLLVLILPSAGSGQAPVRPGPSPSCSACRIVIEPVVRLGMDSDHGALPGIPTSIVRDSRGRYIVAVPRPGEEGLRVYDARGRFLREVGRGGEGPGEYQNPKLVRVMRGDTLVVYDEGLGRLTVLDSGYRVVSTASSPRDINGVVRLGNSMVAVAASIRDKDRIGMPYHLFDAVGGYVRSFGDDREPQAANEPTRNVRWLTHAADGGFWSVRWTHRFQVEHWTSDLRRTIVWEPQAPWFAPYSRVERPTPARSPQGSAYAAWEAVPGQLWVTGQAPQPRWVLGLGEPRQVEGQLSYRIVDRQKVWRGVIEVYDVRSARLMQRLFHDKEFQYVIEPSLLGGYRQDDDGNIWVEVVRVRLQQGR